MKLYESNIPMFSFGHTKLPLLTIKNYMSYKDVTLDTENSIILYEAHRHFQSYKFPFTIFEVGMGYGNEVKEPFPEITDDQIESIINSKVILSLDKEYVSRQSVGEINYAVG